MNELGFIGFVIIVANVIISYQGFKDGDFFYRYKFYIDGILMRKERIRLLSSGFLHVDVQHLAFNMISLAMFYRVLVDDISEIGLIVIYFGSLLGGSLLSLFVHRNHGDYTAVGASGAVSGIVFAYITLHPSGGILLFFIIPMASWFYGISYIIYTIYSIKSQHDNIGHEAHLGGALIGILLALAFQPEALAAHYIVILAMIAPCVLFLYLVINKSHLFWNDSPSIFSYFSALFSSKSSTRYSDYSSNRSSNQRSNSAQNNKKYYTIEDRYNEERRNRELEIDRILEKIRAKGMDALTNEEREALRRDGSGQ